MCHWEPRTWMSQLLCMCQDLTSSTVETLFGSSSYLGCADFGWHRMLWEVWRFMVVVIVPCDVFLVMPCRHCCSCVEVCWMPLVSALGRMDVLACCRTWGCPESSPALYPALFFYFLLPQDTQNLWYLLWTCTHKPTVGITALDHLTAILWPTCSWRN